MSMLPGQLEGSQDRPWALVATIVVVVVCALAIVSTYGRMSQTWDEPNHISTGLEWLQDGRYLMWTENPPLARVAVALGPFLAGGRLPSGGRSKTDIEADGGVSYKLGNMLLYENGSYRRQLALARSGTLPFFFLASAVLWFWLARHNALSGFLAVMAFCTLPAVLAHSGLATTDIAFTAMFLLYIWQLVRWLENSTTAKSALLGVCLGLVIATKFTSIVFVPVASLSVIVARMYSEWRSSPRLWRIWRSRIVSAIVVAAPVGFLVLWGAYGFSVGTLSELPDELDGWVVYGSDAGGLRGALANAVVDISLPAPEFLHGVLVLLSHNGAGHSAYAMGSVSQFGFWYFYPLALLVKTPLPFMIFVCFGLAVAVWQTRSVPWWVWGVFGAIPMILVALLPSHVNIGLRHVLAVYGLAAVGASAVISPMLEDLGAVERRMAASALCVLLGWQCAAVGFSYPSFLTYFNPIAGDDPGAYLVDSDLDWGQGVFELEAFFAQHKAESLYIAYNGSARLCEHTLPELHALQPNKPVRGWIAVSELYYREVAFFLRGEPPCDLDSAQFFERAGTGWFSWLRDYKPVAILGHAIRVYYVE